MGLLSLSMLAINGALRQAILVKGQAQDYTQARFLLEEQIAKVEIQRELSVVENSGRGSGDLARFRWQYRVAKIMLPEPELPPDISPERMREMKLRAPYLAKITATVFWSRGGVEHEETLETLWAPDKLWIPPEERL